jgi:hypothetical protein
MSKTQIALRKAAILIHRWMGVPFAILFLGWFLSGFVMMYSDYPKVDLAQRLNSAAALDPSQVRVSPGEAYAKTGKATPPTRVTLNMLENRPVYRFAQGRQQTAVYADSGDVLSHLPQSTALAVAARFTGQDPQQAQYLGALMDEDQWTLNKNVRPLRPFHKFAWPNGEEVYVSQVSGEVMQHTTRETRLLAWLGAFPHWIYFTEIRKDSYSWRVLVIWLSAIGTVMTVFGLVVGLWLYSPEKRYRFPSGPSSIPYSGQKRWHTVLGLVFGLCTFTWILSGMFSMNPNQWSPDFDGDPAVAERLQGGPWEFPRFASANLAGVVARASAKLQVKELEFRLLAGEIAFVAREAPARSVFLRASGPPQFEIEANSIAMPGIVRRERLSEYDAYYIDRRHQKPLPVEKIELADGSTHYIDVKTGHIEASYVTRSRWNRWLYHGLHSLDLPWLYKYRPLWDVVVLVLMLGGTALSVTSVVIAWRRLARKISEINRARQTAGAARKALEV